MNGIKKKLHQDNAGKKNHYYLSALFRNHVGVVVLILTTTSEIRALLKAKRKHNKAQCNADLRAMQRRKEHEGKLRTFPEDSAQLLFHTGCQVAIITGSWE